MQVIWKVFDKAQNGKFLEAQEEDANFVSATIKTPSFRSRRLGISPNIFLADGKLSTKQIINVPLRGMFEKGG